VATILIIFVRINLPDFVQFTKQRQCRQHKATQEIRSVEGRALPKLKAFGHNPVIIQSRASKQ